MQSLFASHLKSEHLLRSLLREASYLPDANARTYFRRYIVNRFRAYQPERLANTTIDSHAVEKYLQKGPKRRHERIIDKRTRTMQRKGQKGLNYLRRAVQGESQCLEKVLLIAYGRLGPRRHRLLEHLLRPDALPGPTEEPAPLQKLYYSSARYLQFFNAPKKKSNDAQTYTIELSDRFPRLKTVHKTQHAQGISLAGGRMSGALKTPIHNIWLRPMPIRRARNIALRWYADTMTHILPPLPSDEWDAIKEMADGKKHFSFVKRRTAALPLNPDPPAQEKDAFVALVNEAVAMDKPSKADRPQGLNRPHNLTLRFMKRMYSKILTYCCKLTWNEEENRWVVTWGGPLNRMGSHIYTDPVAPSLFAGVDEAGRIPRAPRVPKEPRKPNEKKPKKVYIPVPVYMDYLPTEHPIRVQGEEWQKRRGEQAKKRGDESRFESALVRSNSEPVS
jgi:hypothetical protein